MLLEGDDLVVTLLLSAIFLMEYTAGDTKLKRIFTVLHSVTMAFWCVHNLKLCVAKTMLSIILFLSVLLNHAFCIVLKL